jgi:hypothetical protein
VSTDVELTDDDDEAEQERQAAEVRDLYERIDLLCADLQAAQQPAENVEAGTARVLSGEDPATVASELRALSQAKDLRVAIASQAIEALCTDAAELEAERRGRKVPGNLRHRVIVIEGVPASADAAKARIDDAFHRDELREQEVAERRERDERYEAAKQKYNKAKREYEAAGGDAYVFNALEHGLTEQDMDDLNPGGQLAGRYKRSDYESPESRWQQNRRGDA